MATRRSVPAKDGAAAVAMLDAEKHAAATPAAGRTRRCIGSTKFGIEAHDAPVTDFPVQPSQKDGLGRMCKTHWSQYTSALRKAALARKAPEAEAARPAEPEPAREADAPRRRRTRRTKAETEPEATVEAADPTPGAEA